MNEKQRNLFNKSRQHLENLGYIIKEDVVCYYVSGPDIENGEAAYAWFEIISLAKFKHMEVTPDDVIS